MELKHHKLSDQKPESVLILVHSIHRQQHSLANIRRMKLESSSRACFFALAIATTVCVRGTNAVKNSKKSKSSSKPSTSPAPTGLPTAYHGVVDVPDDSSTSASKRGIDLDINTSGKDDNRVEPLYPGVVNIDEESDDKKGSLKGVKRIVGGDESLPGEFPYFVEMHGCAGSLIAPRVVLTAAHCAVDRYVNQLVTVGAS